MDLSRGLLLLRDALTHHLPTQEQQLARGHAFVRPATAIQRCIGLYTQRDRDLLNAMGAYPGANDRHQEDVPQTEEQTA
jgi:hypothetical protein